MKMNLRHILVWLLLAALTATALLTVFRRTDSIGSLSTQKILRLDSLWEQPENGIYSFTISEDLDSGHLLLLLKTYLRNFNLQFDGREIYSYTSELNELSFHRLTLPGDAVGKELILQTDENDKPGAAYLGNQSAIYANFLLSNSYALVFLILSLLIAAILMVAFLYFQKGMGNNDIRISMFYMALFVLDAGLWVLTDSELLLLVTGRTKVINLISFVTFLIMPIFFLQFIQHMLYKSKLANLLCGVCVLLIAVYLLNTIFPLVPGYFVLIPAHAVGVCALVTSIVNLLKRLHEKPDSLAISMMIGFFLLICSFVIALIRFYNNPLGDYVYYYCIGIMLFVFSLINAVFLNLYGQIKKAVDMEAYKRIAYTDSLTGMKNRTAYTEIQSELDSVSNLFCIVLDINNLKWINDNWGHQAGDLSIITTANFICDVFGSMGSCFRTGGDEFVVFLQDCSAKDLKEGLKKLQERVAAEKHAVGSPFDVAFGFAIRRDGESVRQMIHRADIRMYEEKQRMKISSDPDSYSPPCTN